jgi:hypothetical protein
LLLCAARGRTQERATHEEAIEHFDRGVELVSEEAYAQAVAEFERAYELSRMPAVLYNLGMAYAAAQRPVEATSALERYVQLAADSMPEDERTRIDAELQRQRARIGLVELVVEPEGALVTVDGRDVGTTPLREPVRLGVGEHRVGASRADYERAERVLTVAGGQHRRVQIALRRLSATKPPSIARLPIHLRLPADTSEPATTSANVTGQRSLGYVLGVGGIGLEIAALGVYLAAEGKFRSWSREDKALMVDSVGRTDSSVDQLDRRQLENNALLKSIWDMDTTATALAIGGGSLLLLGGIVLWTAGGEKKSEAPRLQVGLRGTGVHVRSSL